MSKCVKDHPRLCGEKAKIVNQNFRIQGSPPPMRGKAADLGKDIAADGITPAYAGKGISVTSPFTFIRITPAYAGKRAQLKSTEDDCTHHPRLCGEKGLLQCHRLIWYGSPPPMRGKASLILVVIGSIGITPAYAGKSAKIRWRDEWQ